MLAGLEKPTKGEVIIQGSLREEKLNENELVRFRRERDRVYFFSLSTYVPTMNALENVHFS